MSQEEARPQTPSSPQKIAAGAERGIGKTSALTLWTGAGGLYGGNLPTVLIMQHGFSVAGIIPIVAGLIIIPLKFAPPMWPEAP